MKNPHDIIVRALVTEKGTRMREGGNKYLFRVAPEANKIEIKQAVESIFGVKVEGVQTQYVLGKNKRMGVHFGRRSNWKKAIVTLRAGDAIELYEEV